VAKELEKKDGRQSFIVCLPPGYGRGSGEFKI
jgi:hypothetical protein